MSSDECALYSNYVYLAFKSKFGLKHTGKLL